MKRKLKVLSLIMGIITIMSLAVGCGKDKAKETAAPVTSENVKDSMKGVKLQIGTATSYAPFTFNDDSGKRVGFDMDLLEELKNVLGFEYELSVMDYAPLQTSVRSNKLDLAMAALCITPERKEVMDFSDSYYDAGLLCMAKADSDITSVDNLKGKVVAVEEGTSSHAYAQKIDGLKDLLVFPNMSSAYLELENGKAEVVIYDEPNILYYKKIHPESKTKIVGEAFNKDDSHYGILFPKGSENIAKFNAALKLIKENGTYDKIYNKWLGK
ncbi:MAG: transporter substrate-binding domain-containing protein [Clostridium beijerinckii]|jgi:ABC-type amino acid transport substrate-binding protein|nr:transporter substrate-binding domain-containing protein [Clostridium beijerinckii]MCI1584385.1 transporter substrate-binding domain-containing protein [Clostridium beijerinckii]MCI1622515.1 transporter substrate-binding domain-containing protein [Clostridium beijerinckii]